MKGVEVRYWSRSTWRNVETGWALDHCGFWQNACQSMWCWLSLHLAILFRLTQLYWNDLHPQWMLRRVRGVHIGAGEGHGRCNVWRTRNSKRPLRSVQENKWLSHSAQLLHTVPGAPADHRPWRAFWPKHPNITASGKYRWLAGHERRAVDCCASPKQCVCCERRGLPWGTM